MIRLETGQKDIGIKIKDLSRELRIVNFNIFALEKAKDVVEHALDVVNDFLAFNLCLGLIVTRRLDAINYTEEGFDKGFSQ